MRSFRRTDCRTGQAFDVATAYLDGKDNDTRHKGEDQHKEGDQTADHGDDQRSSIGLLGRLRMYLLTAAVAVSGRSGHHGATVGAGDILLLATDDQVEDQADQAGHQYDQQYPHECVCSVCHGVTVYPDRHENVKGDDAGHGQRNGDDRKGQCNIHSLTMAPLVIFSCLSEKTNRKIGIMGGTFDPIHIGHLILGEAAYEQFGLDEVWFLPAGNPPHKRNRAGRAKDAQRVEMVRRAIASNPHFVLCTKEMKDEGYTYSYRTLEAMRKEHPGTEFYFIIGADSLFYFDEWKNPERICAAAKILVATRDRAKEKELLACMERNAKKLHGTFLKLDTPNLDVSSHELREWIREGKSVKYYLPDSVISYIQEQKIYQD